MAYQLPARPSKPPVLSDTQLHQLMAGMVTDFFTHAPELGLPAYGAATKCEAGLGEKMLALCGHIATLQRSFVEYYLGVEAPRPGHRALVQKRLSGEEITQRATGFNEALNAVAAWVGDEPCENFVRGWINRAIKTIERLPACEHEVN